MPEFMGIIENLPFLPKILKKTRFQQKRHWKRAICELAVKNPAKRQDFSFTVGRGGLEPTT
jgi:hypothetical protein